MGHQHTQLPFAKHVCTLSLAAWMQLAETEQEAQAEHERSQAAEQALDSQRRAAEYARSRPTSPFRDPGLQSELTNLRQQVRCTQASHHFCCSVLHSWLEH